MVCGSYLNVLGKVPSLASALATCSSILATLVPIIPTKASSMSTNWSTLVSRSLAMGWQIAQPTVVWHAQFWALLLPRL